MEERRALGIGVAQRDAREVLAEGEEPGGGEGEEDGMHAGAPGTAHSSSRLARCM